jgi:signal peptidase I
METEEARTPRRPPLWLRLTFGSNPSWTILRIVVLIVATFVLFKFVLGLIKVTGDSMFPTFKDGQVKVVNKLAYRKHPPQRGDVVALFLVGRQVLLLKRVIGLPGEKVQIIAGRIYINGDKLEEPYAHGQIPRNLPKNKVPFTLEPHQYYLIGDNREVSEDFVKFDREIFGKVIL